MLRNDLVGLLSPSSHIPPSVSAPQVMLSTTERTTPTLPGAPARESTKVDIKINLDGTATTSSQQNWLNTLKKLVYNQKRTLILENL